MDDRELIRLAAQARKNAYAPYSKFTVGAALLTDGGELFTGCNVENASYGLSICAERVAVCSMVASGVQKIDRVAVVASPSAAPCGACRQFLAEFNGKMKVLVADALDLDSFKELWLNNLLPEQFSLKS